MAIHIDGEIVPDVRLNIRFEQRDGGAHWIEGAADGARVRFVRNNADAGYCSLHLLPDPPVDMVATENEGLMGRLPSYMAGWLGQAVYLKGEMAGRLELHWEAPELPPHEGTIETLYCRVDDWIGDMMFGETRAERDAKQP